jgi:dienelactone hydrolase
MKRADLFFLLTLGASPSMPRLSAQPVPHHFSAISVQGDKTARVSLDGSAVGLFTLTGTIVNKFAQIFDLYPIESSTNLVDWTRLTVLRRTNNTAEALVFQDTNAVAFSQQFYRTPTNHLITFLPQPTGPFSVGTIDQVMVDPSRTNLYRYTPATNAFMVTFWYPAAPPGVGILPSSMWDHHIAADPNTYMGINDDPQWSKIVPAAVGYRFANLLLPSGSTKYPVVLYSVGLSGWRKAASYQAEELASHGYVVVAPDPPDCFGTEFPDGRYLIGNWAGDVPGRLKDFQFLLDELARMEDTDPFFAGRLDLEKIGVFGASFGGQVVETARVDDRVKCAALWDTTNVELSNAGLQKPFMDMLGQDNSFLNEALWLYNHATNDAVVLEIKGADHFTGFDAAWVDEIPQGRAPAMVINACLVWFFDRYLKKEDPTFPTNPEILNVKRK